MIVMLKNVPKEMWQGTLSTYALEQPEIVNKPISPDTLA